MSAHQQILIADQDTSTRFALGQAFGRMGYQVRTTGSIATLLKWVSDGEGDVVIADGAMSDNPVADFVPQIRSWRPRLPVIVTSARRNLTTALDAAKSGAYDCIPKPFEVEVVTAAARRAMANLAAASASARGERPRTAREEAVQIVGRSEAMQKVYRAIARLVGYDLTVLIVGESGSGKELVARALHDNGPRAASRFVIAHAAAGAAERFDTELFGGPDGPGKLLEADGGTLYFDDIADPTPEAQTRLLRVFDGSGPVLNPRTGRPVNVRIIASTNRDLKSLIRQGRFREDLYFRLNIASIGLPPLRDRKEDIPELAQAFLQQAVRQGLPARVLDPSALERLKAHEWPGNVRELEAVIRRICVMADADVITGRMIDQELTDPVVAQEAEPEPESLSSLIEKHLTIYFLEQIEGAKGGVNLFDQITQDMQRPFLQLSMDFVRGNQVHAARMLGLNRNTLRKKLQELGVQSKRVPRRGDFYSVY